MPTTTLRIDDSLRERIARIASAREQTPHGFMLEALEQKADEAEWQMAMHDQAGQRDAAIRAGESVVAWHEMRAYLRARLHSGSTAKQHAKSGRR